ncbi:MAG: tetratricopeptide repeat protein [Planctomycetes bacterium]|nr:tetratricopeptide repeat protein [Planctomycetota bacterium]
MSRWQRYLFGPVAALRPFLLARLFLLMLAVDIWIDFIPHSGPYGVGGFDVAHFSWLDAIFPVPTPALHIGVLAAAGFLLTVCALTGLHRPLLLIACLLFTYGWAMSQHDSYQHHYLLSLVLLCVAFLPRVRAEEVAAPPRTATTSAWAYVLLGTQIAVVYLWTAIAKMDSDWVSGSTITRILLGDPDHTTTASDSIFLWVRSKAGLWPTLAVATIVLEAAMVIGYVFAVGQDRRGGGWSRFACWAFWGVAALLHIGIILAPLRIGIFSLYMLLFACVFLLPLPALARVAAVAVRPARRLEARLDRVVDRSGSRTFFVVEALVLAVLMEFFAVNVDVPGASAGLVAAAGVLLVFAAWEAWRGSVAEARRRNRGAAVFIALSAALVYTCDVPYRVYASIAQARYFVDDPRDVLPLYRKALSYMPKSAPDARLYNNMGDLMHQMNRVPEAIDQYQAALRIDPNAAYAHVNLADALMSVRRHDEAIEHYTQASRLEPQNATMHYNLAYALQTRGRIPEAIEQYRQAIRCAPDMILAHNNLATLLLSDARPEEAAVHLREVLRLDDKSVSALNNLAWFLATHAGRTEADGQQAMEFALRAATLTRRSDPVVLGTLAEAYSAAGDQKQAVATAEEALGLARTQDQPRLVAQIQKRLDRYRGTAGSGPFLKY